MSRCGRRALPFAIVLLGALVQSHAQQAGAGSDSTSNAGSVPPPPSAVVVPTTGQQASSAADDDDDKKRDQAVGADNSSATPEDDYVPNQAPVTPRMRHERADSDDLYVVHVRPLFTTGIKLPEDIIGIAVGAPTLIWAEHNKDVPRLVFVKPLTNSPVNSDIIVSLKSGATITLHVFSDGEKGGDSPVDFMVDYSSSSSLMRGQAEGTSLFRNQVGELSGPQMGESLDPAFPSAPRAQSRMTLHKDDLRTNGKESSDLRMIPMGRGIQNSESHFNPEIAAAAGDIRTSEGRGVFTVPGSLLEAMYQEQVSLATPRFMDGVELSHVYPVDKNATASLAVSIGRMVQQGDTMTFSYSVQNRSNRTIEIMPPHLEFSDPRPVKSSKKHPTAIAEQLTVDDYILTATKLAPGQRVDGAIQFERPSFKYRKQLLMLQVASASEVDTALLLPVPFTTQFGSN